LVVAEISRGPLLPLNVVLISCRRCGRPEDIPLLVQRFLSRSEKPVTIRQMPSIGFYPMIGRVTSENWKMSLPVRLSWRRVYAGMHSVRHWRPPTNGCWLDQVPYREGYWDVVRKVEGRLLKAALQDANGNKAEAARILEFSGTAV
jgi:DNA-binding NtrC family response regulator